MLNVVAKGEFAKRVNISPGRVSQMIREGKLDGCLVRQDGREMVDLDKAVEAMKVRRDPGQAMGNGAKATLQPATPAAPLTVVTSETDEVARKLQRAKLEEAEFRNRKLREEEMARAGTYVLADDVRAETAKLATRMLQLFEGGLTDVANDIAARFKLPQRDVVHILRKRFRDVRTKVSSDMAAEAAALPDTIDVADPQDS